MPKRVRDVSPIPSSDASFSPEPDLPTPDPFEVDTHSSKYVQTLLMGAAKPTTVMKCSLPSHKDPIAFSTFEDFDVHYAKDHAHRCSECRRNFPSEHFLGLHISENHDPLNEAKRARGEKTYDCFVEDCDKVCSNPQKRRMHLVDKHMFPKNYDFMVVNAGIDKRSSMLRSSGRRRSSAATQAFHTERFSQTIGSPQTQAQTDMETPHVSPTVSNLDGSPQKPALGEGDIDDLATTMAALRFVPPSVRFGRGGRRGGLSRS